MGFLSHGLGEGVGALGFDGDEVDLVFFVVRVGGLVVFRDFLAFSFEAHYQAV